MLVYEMTELTCSGHLKIKWISPSPSWAAIPNQGIRDLLEVRRLTACKVGGTPALHLTTLSQTQQLHQGYDVPRRFAQANGTGVNTNQADAVAVAPFSTGAPTRFPHSVQEPS
jgi:hypothetical protein